jgi:hypothetical protein
VAEAEAGEGAAAVATDAVATVPAATTGLAAPGQGTDPGAGPDPDRSEADLPQPSVVAEWREPTEATVVSEWREPGVDAPSVGGQAVGVASPEGPPPGTQVDEQAPPSSGISAETGMLLGLTPYGQAEAAPKSPSAPALPGSGSSAGDPPDAGTGAAPTSAERPGTGAAGEAPATRRSSPLHSPAVTNVAFAMIGLGVLLLLLVLVKLL